MLMKTTVTSSPSLAGTSGITLDSLRVSYHGNVVLKPLSLTIEPGEVLALIGPSGSGKTTVLRLRRSTLRIDTKLLLPAVSLGASPFVMQSTESLLTVAFNISLQKYGGDLAVGAMTILTSVAQMIQLPLTGLAQGAQPILSYNFGAGNGARVRKAFRLALLTAVAAGLGFFGLTALFSRWIVAMFIDSSCPACAIAVRGLPLFASGFVFFAVNIVSIGYFQSVERPRPAMAVTVLRGFVFMAACFFGLPLLLGVEGIWLAVPLAEALTFAVVAAIYGRTRLKSAF